ncbi:hypothetical protein [Flavobacterium sp.]|uniref:hypothetical protein n=1 Tax=Flavobacterium sp. TaxID=239 RepID=UPI0037515884
MKELAKASESEKPISSDKKENSKQEVEILFFHDIKQIEISPIYCINKNFVGDSYSNLYFHTVCYSVFHPPTFIF